MKIIRFFIEKIFSRAIGSSTIATGCLWLFKCKLDHTGQVPGVRQPVWLVAAGLDSVGTDTSIVTEGCNGQSRFREIEKYF